jgi:hypothetical protein
MKMPKSIFEVVYQDCIHKRYINITVNRGLKGCENSDSTAWLAHNLDWLRDNTENDVYNGYALYSYLEVPISNFNLVEPIQMDSALIKVNLPLTIDSLKLELKPLFLKNPNSKVFNPELLKIKKDLYKKLENVSLPNGIEALWLIGPIQEYEMSPNFSIDFLVERSKESPLDFENPNYSLETNKELLEFLKIVIQKAVGVNPLTRKPYVLNFYSSYDAQKVFKYYNFKEWVKEIVLYLNPISGYSIHKSVSSNSCTLTSCESAGK